MLAQFLNFGDAPVPADDALYIHLAKSSVPPLKVFREAIRLHKEKHGQDAPVFLIGENPELLSALSDQGTQPSLPGQPAPAHMRVLAHAKNMVVDSTLVTVGAMLMNTHLQTLYVPYWDNPRTILNSIHDQWQYKGPAGVSVVMLHAKDYNGGTPASTIIQYDGEVETKTV